MEEAPPVGSVSGGASIGDVGAVVACGGSVYSGAIVVSPEGSGSVEAAGRPVEGISVGAVDSGGREVSTGSAVGSAGSVGAPVGAFGEIAGSGSRPRVRARTTAAQSKRAPRTAQHMIFLLFFIYSRLSQAFRFKISSSS